MVIIRKKSKQPDSEESGVSRETPQDNLSRCVRRKCIIRAVRELCKRVTEMQDSRRKIAARAIYRNAN